MTEWHALTDVEIVELVSRLRSLDWSWRLDDAERLASAMGWTVVTARGNWVMLDSGFGAGSAKLTGRDGQVGEIEVQVASDDEAEPGQTRDAFAGMVAALSGAFGEPTARIPGAVPEIRWAGAETTLVLRDPGTTLELFLMANSWLADHDETVDLEEQGLL
ncbi:DUF6301 family protein [Nocardia sp. NPDC050175]|uniref:DUF6301 family protein n=1 Tax=Nocardia sp. NPDC050175 TaxID=3364317 RepID=UPI0037956039